MQHPEIIRESLFPEVRITDDTEWQKEDKEECRKKGSRADKWEEYHRIEEKYPKYRPREGNIVTESDMCHKEKQNPNKDKWVKSSSRIHDSTSETGDISKEERHERIYLRHW